MKDRHHAFLELRRPCRSRTALGYRSGLALPIDLANEIRVQAEAPRALGEGILDHTKSADKFLAFDQHELTAMLLLQLLTITFEILNLLFQRHAVLFPR